MIFSRRQWLKSALSLTAVSSFPPALMAVDPPPPGIALTALTDKAWPTVEKAGDEHKVKVELKFTNSTAAGVNISLFDTITPIITFPDGKARRLGCTREETLRPSPISVAAG